MKDKILEQIIRELIKGRVKTRKDLDAFKRKTAKKHQTTLLSNIQLIKAYHKLTKEKSIQPSLLLEAVLRKRPVRSLSGIVNVSVLTKPWPCPGKCVFCPSDKDLPKSYLKKEPAVQRALLNKFSPYKQVRTRLESLQMTGHPTDKVELRIIGGTWSYYPEKYQAWFVKECFRAANEFGRGQTSAKQRSDLCSLQKKNETARARIIGITIETRPDFINLKEIKRLRKLGVTRVEIGVQTVYDDVLKLIKRGHSTSETIKATQLLKNNGFKVAYQVMLNLPGSNPKKDEQMFKELFSNPDFKPDLLKIYPLALTKNTPLYKWYKQGKFKPYTEKQLTKLLVNIKKHIPYWCRIERVIRDIPASSIIEGGAKKSNLRETAQRILKEKGEACKCIRCREIGKDYQTKEKLFLFRQDYFASEGREVFLSFENKKRSNLYALLRLRLPALETNPQTLPVLKNTALTRELHTFGPMAPIATRRLQESALSPQHKGLGKKLIQEAEKIAQRQGFKKIANISGIGARGYYRAKLNYHLKQTYMLKNLR